MHSFLMNGCFRKAGNCRFRSIISSIISVYKQARKKKEKMAIISSIADYIKQTGGRFLKQDGNEKWIEMDSRQIKEKIGKAIRDSEKERGGKRRLQFPVRTQINILEDFCLPNVVFSKGIPENKACLDDIEVDDIEVDNSTDIDDALLMFDGDDCFTGHSKENVPKPLSLLDRFGSSKKGIVQIKSNRKEIEFEKVVTCTVGNSDNAFITKINDLLGPIEPNDYFRDKGYVMMMHFFQN